MSGDKSNNNNKEEGWGSKFLKVASAAAATAAVAGGLYALLSSSSATEPHIPMEADDDDDDDHHKIHTLMSSWKKPDLGWVKLNVDGSRRHQGPSPGAGCGGVFRDDSGNWLHGFALKLDHLTYQVDETEMKAILTGLELARERMNWKKLIVESDHDSVVSMVENANPRSHHMIKSIKKLCDDPTWEVKVVSISRNANGVADRLAKDARSLLHDRLLEYPYPPNNCVPLLHKDNEQGEW